MLVWNSAGLALLPGGPRSTVTVKSAAAARGSWRRVRGMGVGHASAWTRSLLHVPRRTPRQGATAAGGKSRHGSRGAVSSVTPAALGAFDPGRHFDDGHGHY